MVEIAFRGGFALTCGLKKSTCGSSIKVAHFHRITVDFATLGRVSSPALGGPKSLRV